MFALLILIFCFRYYCFRWTGPREGEIQIDCRWNGNYFYRIGWLL